MPRFQVAFSDILSKLHQEHLVHLTGIIIFLRGNILHLRKHFSAQVGINQLILFHSAALLICTLNAGNLYCQTVNAGDQPSKLASG